MRDETLGGYLELHACPPAFEGIDGRSYTADAWVDEEPGADGSYGASIIFVRWTSDGGRPDGHLETGCLASADSPEAVRAVVLGMTLHELKRHLDRLIETSSERLIW